VNKPDWSEAPDGAQFLAMDGDNNWYWFASEPVWDEEFQRWDSEDELWEANSISAEETLERRP
jgi:hypothetical protein